MTRKGVVVGLCISLYLILAPTSDQVSGGASKNIKSLNQSAFADFVIASEDKRAPKFINVSAVVVPNQTMSALRRKQLAIASTQKTASLGIIQKKKDFERKVANVKKVLSSYNAPASKHADLFVLYADKYNIDYRLLPAISIVESGGCRHNFKPYNCFGWGKKTFVSYEDAIQSVSEGIANKYGSASGYNTYAMGKSYCPSTWQSWGSKVKKVMAQIEK